jgi:ankyrin repeat protein
LLGNFSGVESRLGQDARAGRNEADLILAAKSGNLRSVRNLVQNTDVHINACCKDRKTALLHACENGNRRIVKELVNAVADVHARSSERKIPITAAARVNDTEIVNILLEGGALIDERGEDSKTALIVAAEEGNVAVVRGLLELRSNPNSKDKDGNTALILAAGNGHLDVVDLLISSKASVNVKGSGGQTALINAAKNNQADVKHRPIKAKAYVDTRDENDATALIYAADLGHEEPAGILIKENADVNTVDRFGNSPLMNALLGRNRRIIQLLKDAGARTGEKSAQFIIAAAEGNLSELEALLSDKDLGKDVMNIQVSGGDTPLILALKNEQVEVAHRLIEAGADVDITGRYGCTALILAVETGDEALVKAVTDTSRASVNAVYRRETASTIAEKKGYEEILKLLVDHCGALKSDDSVYVTLRGNHYHVQTCHYWSTTCERKTLKEALEEKFSPCSLCVLRLHEHGPV